MASGKDIVATAVKGIIASVPGPGGIIAEFIGYAQEKTLAKRQQEMFDLINIRLNPQHKSFLLKAKRKKSYYMGAWHTHPQPIPVPSNTDWEDWKETLKLDKTGCRYVFFVIAGIKEWRLWAGDSITNEITEIHECRKNEAGLYLREELYQAFCRTSSATGMKTSGGWRR